MVADVGVVVFVNKIIIILMILEAPSRATETCELCCTNVIALLSLSRRIKQLLVEFEN